MIIIIKWGFNLSPFPWLVPHWYSASFIASPQESKGPQHIVLELCPGYLKGEAAQRTDNSDDYRWINQCFGISQKKPASSSKGGTC